MDSESYQINQEKIKQAFLLNPTLMVYFLQEYYPLTVDLIRKVQNHQQLSKKFMWTNLLKNPHINFNEELLETFKDKIDWDILSHNPGTSWKISLLEKYKDKLNWSGHKAYGMAFDSDENCLSTNVGLPWSEMLIERYQQNWNWTGLSGNPGLPWSMEFIEKYLEKWDWTFLSNNTGVPWSLELIEKFDKYLDYTVLMGNRTVPWSVSMLLFMTEKKEKWNIVLPDNMNYMHIRYMNKGFLYNDKIPWDNGLKEYFIDRYGNKDLKSKEVIKNYYGAGGVINSLASLKKIDVKLMHWCDFLKVDESINWSEEMVIYVAENNYKGWEFASGIVNLSLEILESLSNYLDWNEVSENNKNIGDFTFLEKYRYRVNYYRLSRNRYVHWDINFLRKYGKDSSTISWGEVNNSLNLPYSVDFIREFAGKLYRPVKPAWEVVEPYVDDHLIYTVLKET